MHKSNNRSQKQSVLTSVIVDLKNVWSQGECLSVYREKNVVLKSRKLKKVLESTLTAKTLASEKTLAHKMLSRVCKKSPD